MSTSSKCTVESFDLKGNDFKVETDTDKSTIERDLHHASDNPDKIIVEEINLSDCEMTDAALLPIIGCFKFVKKINLSRNNLTYISLVKIFQVCYWYVLLNSILLVVSY